MAPLTAAARRALPASAFAGPDRSYPIPDKSHATFAKAMATRHAGPALKARVDTAVARKFPHANLGGYLHPPKVTAPTGTTAPRGRAPSLAGQVTSMRGAGAFRQPGGGVLKGIQARGGY